MRRDDPSLRIEFREHLHAGDARCTETTVGELPGLVASALGLDVSRDDREVHEAVENLLEDGILRFEGDPPLEVVELDLVPTLPLRAEGQAWLTGWDIPVRWVIDAKGQPFKDNAHGGGLKECTPQELLWDIQREEEKRRLQALLGLPVDDPLHVQIEKTVKARLSKASAQADALRWHADPFFARHVCDVRVTLTDKLAYLYVNLGLKNLHVLSVGTDAKELVFEFWLRDPDVAFNFRGGRDEKIPDDVPEKGTLTITGLPYGRVMLHDVCQYEMFACVVLGEARENLVGETKIRWAPR